MNGIQDHTVDGPDDGSETPRVLTFFRTGLRAFGVIIPTVVAQALSEVGRPIRRPPERSLWKSALMVAAVGVGTLTLTAGAVALATLILHSIHD